MPCQPSSRGQRVRALPRVLSLVTAVVTLWLATSTLCLWPSALSQEVPEADLTANTGRRLLLDDGTLRSTIDINTAADLYDSVARADGSDWLLLNLPPGSLVLNSTLIINVSTTLQGAPATADGPGTILSCGPGKHGLIEFSGSHLHIIGVQLQDCEGPGLHITSAAVDANITIEDSLFQNFARILDDGRVDVFNPGLPADISDSTLALAVHADNFSGNLTVRNTRFVDNHFSLSATRRRLYDVSGALLGDGHRVLGHRQHQLVRTPAAAALRWRGHSRRVLATRGSMELSNDPWVNGVSSRDMSMDSGHAAGGRRRQLVGSDSQAGLAGDSVPEDRYSMPLLEVSDQIHPGLLVGPWADDLETVFTVVCKNQDCAVTFENSTFDGNTGVATGALYVFCDGAKSCDVDLTDTTITNNRVLWQQATARNLATSDDAADEDALPPGVRLLMRMAAWLTYTYPLLEHFKTHTPGEYDGIQATNLELYPKVVGRTLGAVVFHQRNSPSPGVLPSEPRPMMLVTVNGGELSGNEGAAIMSTATDFMSMAGGNGTWPGGPPRHSADIYISGVNVTGHTSGWPAIWLRWARRVEIRNLQVTGSTGAAWLEEVRDSALVEDSVFEGNFNTDTWVDYMYYVPLTGGDIGADISQTLKIQMTPLGDVPNSASVRGCQFEGNPSVTTGVVYIRASDSPYVDVENQPGRTRVEVLNTTFADNYCSSPDGKCFTGERPLYIFCMYEASVQLSRFLGNANGGLSLTSVYSVVVSQSVFDGNNLTYSNDDFAGVDQSFGGAGVYGESIGTGGFKIVDTNFTNNKAAVGGGAIYLRFFEFLNANGNRFEGNSAALFDGGAIWLEKSNGETSTSIDDCTFVGNTAGRNGGAISAFDISQSSNEFGWSITESTFTNNVALLSPADRGATPTDQAGGGAVFAYAAALRCEYSKMNGNKVLAHAGGAIRVVDSNAFRLLNCTFENNVAVMGGAVALSRLSGFGTVKFCAFTNNTVVEPSWQYSSAAFAPSLSFIDPGYGGALYAFYSTVVMLNSGLFVGNSAKFGGAIAVVSSPKFYIQEDDFSNRSSILYANVSREVAESVGFEMLSGSALPYRFLFSNNTALIGGALYMYDTESARFAVGLTQYVMLNNRPQRVNGKFVETEASIRLKGQPGVLFLRNTANGGGAVYLEGNGQVNFKSCRFAANRAMVPPLAANYSGLYGLEKNYTTAKALPCYNGGGGAMCVVGRASEIIMLNSSDLVNNFAKDGAGIFIAEGLDCIDQANCYSVVLNLVNMTGNTASSRGGGVFWMHEGVLDIATCPTDKMRSFQTNGTALLDDGTANVSAAAGMFTINLRAPLRKSPSSWYEQLTLEHQDMLLSSVGGAVRSASSTVRTVNGEVVVVGNPVFALGVDTVGATVLTPNGTVAVNGSYLTNEGNVVLPDTSNDEPLPGWVPSDWRPVVLNEAALPDPSWLGVPYNNLPCANWNNSADTGSDVSTTPYYVLSPLRLDYYTSNSDIKVNVTVHDWLGQPCTGGNDTQPLVLVSADSMEVSGSLTVPAENGMAAFTAMRLRAREGLHNVTMTARVHAPIRDLLSSELHVYVRPCAINEFLSPKNLDECIPCDSGAYNLNMSAVTCMGCPYNAKCSYPDPAACKLDIDCDPAGFLVPNDGYWHANFFSEEVIECTNQDACKTENRSRLLSNMQSLIWQTARKIQLDAATAVADKAAMEALEQLLSASLVRRLLQEKALGDNLSVLLILNATGALLPEYLQTQCAPGYTGTLCGECEPGYGWCSIATCSKCPSRTLNNLYYALVTLLTLSLLAFTVYSSLKEQRRPGRLVGGTNDKSKPKNVAKVKPTSGSLGVQASGPSQFHVIIAAAAAEDAAAEAAPALALLRERSHTPMGEMELGSTYEYVDPVLAAARNQYASAPGTPKGRQGSPAPFPVFDTALRAHSVLGVPARASRWAAGIDDSRNTTASFSRMDRGAAGVIAGGHFVMAGGSNYVVSGNHLIVAGGSNYSAGGGGGGAGPVAEGAVSGYSNALYDGTAAAAGVAAPALHTEIQPVEEDVEEGYLKEEVMGRAVRPSDEGRRPVAESTDYTNQLYEGLRPAENQSTGAVGAAGSLRGAQAVPAGAAESVITTPTTPDNNNEGSGLGCGPDAPEVSPRGRQMPPGVMLQSVPVIQSDSSPPRTPMHGSVTSMQPGVMELPTLTERVRLGEIPRQGAVVGRERAHQSTVVKIFLSYVQVLALLQYVPLEIPGVVDIYYRINNQAISYPGILVSLDCSLPETSVSKAFVRVILTVLAPLYIFVGAVVWFLIFNVIDYYILAPYYAKRPSKTNRKRHLQMPSFMVHLEVYLGRQLIVTFITIFFFFYPSVVRSVMTIFNCNNVNVQATGNPLAIGLGLRTERVWSQDYSQQCYKGSHLALALGLGVPGVLLIAIGWPLISGLFMTGKLTCMNNISLTEDMTSFFLADFKARYAWWESLIMLRKLFIAVIVTLVDGKSSAGVQLLLVICILVVASGIHLVAMPYHHIYTNNLELMSLGTLLATLYFSLYFGFSTSLSDGGRIAISILILAVNIIMVLIFVYYIVQAYYYAALCKTGLSDLDSETRRKLTAAELHQRILENLNARGSSPSFQDGQQQSPAGNQRPRSNYQHMASFYTAAVWASMRMGSTTNKVFTKVRTMLRDTDFSNPSSREGSISGQEVEGVPVARGRGDGSNITAPANNNNTLNSHDSDAILGGDDDPEAARGSAAGRKRAVSGPGSAAAAAASAKPQSLLMVKPGSGREVSISRSHSQSSPGIEAACANPGLSSAAAPLDRASNGSHRGELMAAAAVEANPTTTSTPSPRAEPKVISRGSSTASLDNPSLPPFPTELDIAAVTPQLPAAVAALPLPVPPAAAVLPVGTSPRPGVRLQSRLAQASGQIDRSGELLPPPPSFPRRGGTKP